MLETKRAVVTVQPEASHLVRWAHAASALPVVMGAVVLLGWMLDNEILKRGNPRAVAVNPAAAVTFIVLGVSLRLCQATMAGQYADQSVQRLRRWAQLGAAIVIFIGLLKLGGLIIGRESGIDRWLFHNKLDLGSGLPNRMAPQISGSFSFSRPMHLA